MTSVCPRAVKICTDLVDLFEGVGEDREEELAVRPLNVARNRSFSDLEKVSGHLKMSWTIREGEASAPSPSAFGGVQASAVFSSRSSFSAGSTIGLNVINLSSAVSKLAYFESFRRFLEAESSEENLYFWLEAEEYRFGTEELRARGFLKKHGYNQKSAIASGADSNAVVGTQLPSLMGSANADEVTYNPWRRLKQIHNNYVKAGSPLQINISSVNRKKIANLIEGKNPTVVTELDNLPPSDILVSAQNEIFKLMKNDSYSRFKKSKFMKEYEKGVMAAGVMSRLLNLGDNAKPEAASKEEPTPTSAKGKLTAPSSVVEDKSDKKNNKFRRRFSTSEALLHEEKAYLREKVTVKGTLYITQSGIHFYGHVFGLRKKFQAQYTQIVDINRMEESPQLEIASDAEDQQHTVNICLTMLRGKDVMISGISELCFQKFLEAHKTFYGRVHAFSKSMESAKGAGEGAIVRSRSSAVSSGIPSGDSEKQREEADDSEATTEILELPFWSSFHGHSLSSDQLSERDLTLILGGADERFYTKNAIILKQNTESSSLFQVAMGEVRIEVGSDPPRVVRRMCGGITTATVVADSDNVVILEISNSVFEHFMKVEIGLSGRFHKFFALMVVERLQATWEEKKIAPIGFAEVEKHHRRRMISQLDAEVTSDSDVEHSCRRFYTWMWVNGGSVPPLYGRLYVYRNDLVFLSRVFHCRSTDKWRITDVKRVMGWVEALQVTDAENIFAEAPPEFLAGSSVIVEMNNGQLIVFMSEELDTELIVEMKSLIEKRGSEKLSEFNEEILQEISEQNSAPGCLRPVPSISSVFSSFLQYVHIATFGENDYVYDHSAVPGLYQVLRGRVGVYRNGEKLARLGMGDVVGEASLLKGVPLSLKLVAERPYTVVALLELPAFMLSTRRSSKIADRFYKFLATELVIKMKNGVMFAEF